MDAQGPGSPYQQTLQQEPQTNGATPTTCTISTSFHLSSRTIATPPPSTRPPLSYSPACAHTRTASSPLHFFLVWRTPPAATSTSSAATIPSRSTKRTHLRGLTHSYMHLHRRRFPSCLPVAQSRQPPGMGEYYECGLIGRSL